MDKNEEITLSAFLNETRERLAKFELHWRKRNAENPDDFPNRMLPGDWDEQFFFTDFESEG